MTTSYTSRYAELGFYVDGQFHRFSSGYFRTDDPKVIAVLDRLADAVRDGEPEPVANKAEEAPKPAPKPRKAAADTSAK